MIHVFLNTLHTISGNRSIYSDVRFNEIYILAGSKLSEGIRGLSVIL